MPATTRSSTLLVAAVWLVVALPTLWGFSYTVRNAMKLFHPAAAAAAPPPPGANPAR